MFSSLLVEQGQRNVENNNYIEVANLHWGRKQINVTLIDKEGKVTDKPKEDV